MEVIIIKQALKEYRKLSEPERVKVRRVLEHIKEFGPIPEIPGYKKLTGTSLEEIRILGANNIRLIFFTYKRVVFILLIFHKKTRKTPHHIIKTATKRMKSVKTAT